MGECNGGRGEQGDETPGSVERCKSAKVGREKRWCRVPGGVGSTGDAVQMCKSAKVEKWEGRIRGRGGFSLQFLKFF